jgi:hypothetical protein
MISVIALMEITMAAQRYIVCWPFLYGRLVVKLYISDVVVTAEGSGIIGISSGNYY